MSDAEQTPLPLTDLNEEERMMRETVAEFARDAVGPHVEEMDRAAKLDAGLISQIFEMGLMGIEIPVEYGGSGSSFMMATLVIEELAHVDASVSVFVDVQNTLVNNVFLNWGSEEQKKRFLPRLAADTVGAYCLSEAESGSDAFALKARATEVDGGYQLDGQKLWITNGGEAGIFIVFATVNPDLGYRGITCFAVEKGTDGLRVGKKEDKLGIRASSTTEVFLENCFVPKENIIGEVGRGYKIAIETLNEGRIGIGAQMIGIARGALEHARKHLLERKQFRQPLANFQGIQFQFAQCATEIEAARLLVYNAARLRDAGRPFLTQAAMAKLYASQVAGRVSSQAVELMGGVGFTREYPVEKYYRDAKIGAIYEGTSNMQLQTIAKQVLLGGEPI